MKVEQLMTKNPRACAASDTLNDAARIMSEADCGMVPVVEENNVVHRLIGVVTDRDISMAAYTSGRSLKELSLDSAMSKDIRTCAPEDSLEVAEQAMREAQVRRLPVVDGAGSILGVLSLADIARQAERERDRKSPQVTESEVGTTLSAIAQPRVIAA